MRTRHVIGVMTGTSLDGLDAALVRIEGTALAMSAQCLQITSRDLPEDLRQTLLAMCAGRPIAASVYPSTARHLGHLHADVCEELTDTTAVDFVCAHGQTIWHQPNVSWQLFDPWPIVRRLGLAVCYDLRQADLIAGGQGAPITPLADQILFGTDEDWTVINLGGICNITYHHRSTSEANHQPIQAHDLCPANLLLDGLCQRLINAPFDEDGQAAEAGHPLEHLMQAITDYERVANTNRSLGREQFGLNWIEALVESNPGYSANQWLASAITWLAQRIVGDITPHRPDRIILAGGGVKNSTLVERVREEVGGLAPVTVSDDLGIPCQGREAIGFAVLGALSQDGIAITLAQVTGADKPGVAGAWAGLT